ncbi:MAG TPA: hypothetical protein EYP24_01435 [bacterium (Candidatus Stahlbacteria)]|nr:hypothetical protein [Candidatus Stahlbacteria bacterium]
MKKAFTKTVNQITSFLPILIGIILLIGLLQRSVLRLFYLSIFHKNPLIDPVIGAALGSILAGHPITSYILGGEFLKQGVSLIAVLAFLVSWVTVGITQLPVEIIYFGRRFALIRNTLSFVFAILVAITTAFLLKII